MTEIRVPKLNANDVTYTLIEWIASPGAVVEEGDPVATVETSKAAEELAAPADGIFHPLVAVGTECHVGQVIARLSTSAVPAPPVGAGMPDGLVITEPAARYIAAHNVDMAAVRALGRKIIRVADLEPPAEELAELPKVQQAVAAVVAESHREIPPAFVAVKVILDPALAHARTLTRIHKRLIGVPELLIAAIGALLPQHPMCFAALAAPGRVRHAGAANVGVTIDVGRGLHVPVLPDVGATSIRDLASRLMALRTTAMRGTFTESAQTGANILVALHTDDEVTLAVPVVLPGTSCAVSLAGRQRELTLTDDDNALTWQTTVQLGIAYDHRVLNGREATAFLKTLRDLLHDPERIAT